MSRPFRIASLKRGTIGGTLCFSSSACLSEQTGFPSDVCEMALAHTIKNKVEAAYRRGDLFEKRRELMDAWAGFVDTGKLPCETAEKMNVGR